MSLATLRDVLLPAYREGYAVAGFVVLGWEDARAFAKAAQAEGAALILQAGPNCRKNTPLTVLASMFHYLAENYDIPVVAHFDHAYSEQDCYEAIEHGFSSVMYDGSALPFEENIDNTRRIVEKAKKYNVSVEAELGVVGYANGKKSLATDPQQAGQFAGRTGIDALAISIGNIHLQANAAAELNTDQLAAIEAQTSLPLVIHGGSGVDPAERRRLALNSHICKFNIGTELRMIFGQSLRETIMANPQMFDRIELITSTESSLEQAARAIIRNLKSSESG